MTSMKAWVTTAAETPAVANILAHTRSIRRRSRRTSLSTRSFRGVGIPSAVGLGNLPEAELLVDSLLGYSQTGPRAPIRSRLSAASGGRGVLALDVPSGLELATDELHEPHARADATLTLAAPKSGLRSREAEAAIGDLS
jgi:NAD(P)H-hydrate repair Nnr-like enzyme with NAD(P)H-hydrate epimerase domain